MQLTTQPRGSLRSAVLTYPSNYELALIHPNRKILSRIILACALLAALYASYALAHGPTDDWYVSHRVWFVC